MRNRKGHVLRIYITTDFLNSSISEFLYTILLFRYLHGQRFFVGGGVVVVGGDGAVVVVACYCFWQVSVFAPPWDLQRAHASSTQNL